MLAKKLGMTQLFLDDGTRVPVTVLSVKGNTVLAHRTEERDGYTAIQLAYDDQKASRLTKPDLGRFKQADVSPKKFVKEFRVGTDVLEKYPVGSEIPIDLFADGDRVDVTGTSKGKGFQGVIKRFGVKELPKWHKHRKGSRSGPGSRGPATTFSWSEVPQPGQMGFHRRTEYNKRIIKIGDNGLEVTPAGGFLHYGIVRSSYVLLAGSIPGTPKRPIVLRHPVRPRWMPEAAPKITYISLQSKQGN